MSIETNPKAQIPVGTCGTRAVLEDGVVRSNGILRLWPQRIGPENLARERRGGMEKAGGLAGLQCARGVRWFGRERDRA
jgi:hypothetical protein